MAKGLDEHIIYNKIQHILTPDEWNYLLLEKQNAEDGKIVFDMESEHGQAFTL